jgi:predicted nucleotidyltransferase/predicted transcriptional regulator
MLEEILDTRIKIKIARLFAENERESLTVSDISRRLIISKSRASECLRELYEKGVLERRDIGRNAVYRLASNGLAKAVAKSVTQDRALLNQIERALLSRLKRTRPVSIVLFGSALKGLKTASDIDFLLIYEKDVNEREIYKLVGELTQQFGFHISILTMSLREFRGKARKGEAFVLDVLATNKLIYGKDLEKLVW